MVDLPASVMCMDNHVPMAVSTSTFAFNQMSSQYMKNSPKEMADMIFGLPKVSRELKKKLDGSIRLKNPVKVSMMKTSCFYMVNEKAEYAKNLKNAEGNDRDYLLFNLNRTDCIEQIEIYDILSPEDIHLVFME